MAKITFEATATRQHQVYFSGTIDVPEKVLEEYRNDNGSIDVDNLLNDINDGCYEDEVGINSLANIEDIGGSYSWGDEYESDFEVDEYSIDELSLNEETELD